MATGSQIQGYEPRWCTCKDFEGVLGLVQAPQPPLAACHAQPQAQRKVAQRLVPRSPVYHPEVSDAADECSASACLHLQAA